MAGPWELYQTESANRPRGPWDLFSAPLVNADPAQTQNWRDAVVFGLQSSATGLAVRGDLPEQQLPENAPIGHRSAAAQSALLWLPAPAR
jgi:hypothetical protein